MSFRIFLILLLNKLKILKAHVFRVQVDIRITREMEHVQIHAAVRPIV